ncbi:MAG: outer membrane lipoprotein-sorting protein [Melioribacteraceae bacterium]|nr:outer membrane lipoprotein-sorting protein [Melioribacteraceae bacterium]MCF8354026.1 outer membrane lipoprotein-sorting protein [Melioribacteraceae bacterium]MCF8392293.1 outer membrane lipoprotein-sorting protein [Melioribacteraceae bacterium]MCF8417625.1 outer membrane lipoprotein-sorting protein [Melioribacteraceae bacterium]
MLLIVPCLMFPQTAEEIINKAEDNLKGENAHGIIKMTVETPDYTRELKMESWWEGNEKALIVIQSPPKEAGNKTLKIGNEMWSYLKNTETTIKIPPSMMLQSWNGSDFTNDDLVRESNLTDDYTQKLLGDEKIDGELCWKIELIPEPDAPVVWGRLLYWVRKVDNLAARVDYYDEKGNLVRYMEFSGVMKMDDRLMPTRWAMHNNIKEGNSTVIEVIKMEFDIKLNERIFSFRELERGN